MAPKFAGTKHNLWIGQHSSTSVLVTIKFNLDPHIFKLNMCGSNQDQHNLS